MTGISLVIQLFVLCATFSAARLRLVGESTPSGIRLLDYNSSIKDVEGNSTILVHDLRNPWIEPTSIRSRPGRQDEIICSVTSNTAVRFEWLKDGQVIQDVIISNMEPRSTEIIDLRPIRRDRKIIYKSILRFKPLTLNSNGSYSCLIQGPGYEKVETVACSVIISSTFNGYHHEMTSERKFLAGAIIFIFSILFVGTILVTILSFKL